ncbi:hypothetical protein PHLGIDRAFT_34454 [Phlebiopsis gigantea 11061_1 CR5-6]|uniref:OPT superfamily n=1 Tax=Phlebiopsis gigantea (strain 11061_1 CR5-6) TaxID=745531 RepID=A0A0C3SAQ9_PHLG1|nr:hypothetical protein PHLGIDRAFT_34454 [Phlebiopsis gigantea 11061_1 CR5-6]
MSTPSIPEKYDVESEKQKHEVHLAVPVAEFDDPNLDLNAELLEDDSPYPEVRSAVANTDDPDMPCGTFRSWLIGIIWAILIPGLNQFFFFRYPSVTVSGVVAQLISFPVLRLWARLVPSVKIFGVAINPGPFTVKEHVLITIMASVGSGSAYATDIIAVQRVYYNQVYNFGYQWLLVMSTQLIGFSIGGIARRFLVNPPSMIWPANLVTCALFNTLHSQQYAGMGTRGGVSRERFFFFGFLASFCWYFLPGYLFAALSYTNWVCWIAPNNIVVNQLFGTVSGLGMSLVSFDWSQIAYIGSPLATPWWAEANIAFGMVFFFWIITPAIYYTNTWYAKYMPISSTHSFDNTGASYKVFGTASIIWGVIGPARQFSSGQIYYGLVFFFLAGFLAPLLTWLVQKRFHNTILKYLNWPVIFSGTGLIPPATPSNYVTWSIVGFLFNYVIRRRHFSWWTKYNYVLSAALDAGVAVSVVVIFFCLQYPRNGSIGLTTVQSWWGNTVSFNTADARKTPLLTVADGEFFGPRTWS